MTPKKYTEQIFEEHIEERLLNSGYRKRMPEDYSIDKCLSMELKNSLTGQFVEQAIKQYKHDRDPREPFFQFKRVLVHFAVGNEKVFMTTRLSGDKTYFLPFNLDTENPVNRKGHKTAYLVGRGEAACRACVHLMGPFLSAGTWKEPAGGTAAEVLRSRAEGPFRSGFADIPDGGR